METKRNNVKDERSGEPEVVTSIRLTREQHDKLKRIAAAAERSLSQQLRYVVEHLDEAA